MKLNNYLFKNMEKEEEILPFMILVTCLIM